ncbi:hypothetical protein FGG78_36410 [Thioclava sp. BHET1]|nr:hypothetical protein FGG78_36410 [Thioclava sp. BHET1]
MSTTSQKLFGALVAAGLAFGLSNAAMAASTCTSAHYKAEKKAGKLAKGETWKTYSAQCKKATVHKAAVKKTMTKKAPATTAPSQQKTNDYVTGRFG